MSRKLKHPRIQEALVELRATFARPLTLDDLSAFRDEIGVAYPHISPQREWSGRIDLGAAGPATSGDLREVGFLLTTTDKTRAVQARVDGLRFSRLDSYDGWEPFLGEVQRLWAKYRAVTNPIGVERIGVRFINRYPIPPVVDLKDYLKTGAELAPALPQEISSLFFRVVVPIDPRTSVVVTQLIDPTKEQSALVLDIDAMRLGPFELKEEVLWSGLDALRTLKNQFFFESVTDKIITLCGGDI